MDPFALILLIISGVAWTIVYVESIRIGFKKKTYCMPLWALGLNICWELIYAFKGITNPSVQAIANAVWACCDLLIVVTYFKFGKNKLPEKARDIFIPYSVLAFVSCFVLQLAFILHFENYVEAAQYSAFLQNVAMSILFIVMLYKRNSSEGQSMLIAVAKWLGTLAPTIQQGIVQGFNIFILMTGILCSAWDIAYIILLKKKMNEEEGKQEKYAIQRRTD